MWRVEFKQQALHELRGLETVIAQRVVSKAKWLSENIEQITPQPLSGSFHGLFKLRVGDYRVIYSVDPNKLVLTVHMLGHRREIYRDR